MLLYPESPCLSSKRPRFFSLRIRFFPLKFLFFLKKTTADRTYTVCGAKIEKNRKRLAKKDKQRKTYYKYYTDKNWGDFREYDVILDSGSLGEAMCVKTICQLAENFPE